MNEFLIKVGVSVVSSLLIAAIFAFWNMSVQFSVLATETRNTQNSIERIESRMDKVELRIDAIEKK
jgi:sensor domain CHASE-containing protein